MEDARRFAVGMPHRKRAGEVVEKSSQKTGAGNAHLPKTTTLAPDLK